jgi:hypothetical protein
MFATVCRESVLRWSFRRAQGGFDVDQHKCHVRLLRFAYRGSNSMSEQVRESIYIVAVMSGIASLALMAFLLLE